MKKTILKILTVITILIFVIPSCESNLKRIVKKYYPCGQERIVFYYNGEPSQQTWTKAEIYYENSQIMTIKRYKDGSQDGWTESYYNDGSEMAKVMYKKGEKIGHYYKKYQNGQIAYTGDYKENKRNGDWISMNEEGDTTKIEKYDIGRLVGLKDFTKKQK